MLDQYRNTTPEEWNPPAIPAEPEPSAEWKALRPYAQILREAALRAKIAAALLADWQQDHPVSTDYQRTLACVGAARAAEVAVRCIREAA